MHIEHERTLALLKLEPKVFNSVAANLWLAKEFNSLAIDDLSAFYFKLELVGFINVLRAVGKASLFEGDRSRFVDQ